MQTFRIIEISDYCHPINYILDICRNYQHSNTVIFFLNTLILKSIKKKINEKEEMQ